jgi:hypothetical protein
VRIGNAAVSQYQADVVGEVMVALEKLRLAGGKEDTFSWTLQRTLLEFVETHYHDRDCGLGSSRSGSVFHTFQTHDVGRLRLRALTTHGRNTSSPDLVEVRLGDISSPAAAGLRSHVLAPAGASLKGSVTTSILG